LTTPEFQLTSDTGVALQMNFVTSGILDGSGNTNGLSSYIAGSNAINLDLSPWMDARYTADANVPALVDSLNMLLLAGQLSPAAKAAIVDYVVNNFPSDPNSDPTWQLDRVAAVVQQIINSPDFLIQN
jgi:hypothetical protein